MNKKGLIYVTLVLLLSLLACQGCTLSTETQANTLTLSGGMGGNDIALNAAQSMNITLREIDEFFFTDTMLLNRLVTHDDSVDIYYVEGNMISTNVIFRKDFAAPITQPDLVAIVEGMYAPLRKAVMDEQTVMGMPIFVSSQENCLAYDLAAYETCLEEGYTLPNSWIQLLEQIAQWDEALWQQQISPVNMDSHTLVHASLDYIIAQQQVEGEEAGLSSEDIVSLMETAYGAAQNMEAHHADQKEHILFWRQGIAVSQSETNGFHTYPLPLWEGDVPTIPLRVCVAFINPYSKKQDLAQEFLVAYYHQMDPMLQMALSPQANQPVENANAIEQMLQGQMTPSNFCRELDRVMQMKEAESS